MKLFGREAEHAGSVWRGNDWEVRMNCDTSGFNTVEVLIGTVTIRHHRGDPERCLREVEGLLRGMLAPLKDLVGQ